MKLTPKQIEVLQAGGASGYCIKGQWIWLQSRLGQNVTGTVKSLMKRGLMDAIYFVGGKAGANITDAGRQALLEASTGRVRLDKAVEGMVAAG